MEHEFNVIKMDVSELIRKEGLRRGLSHKTIRTYMYCVRKFFNWCRMEPNEIKKADIKSYLDLMIGKGACGNTINVNLNALRFFYCDILNKRLMVNIRYSKTPKALPIVLTKEEVARLINSISNPKHKLMAKLLYSAGLRVNELVHLKAEDLNIENGYGWVRHGKGNKDRMFVIAESLKEELALFILKECASPNSYIFRGFNGHLTTASVRSVIKNAVKNAKISKHTHPHTLRHSFSTHLIENGSSVAEVQSLLGHSSSETTMAYLHIASPRMIGTKSPIDSLPLV
ncbi:tyrosine-type recombinase/integrase [Candidatus Woesearchaeota archaeon]|nr:tyrosine-type recombinase/integrase [Candidatus Woesearchaeota archaeon]